MTRYIDADWAKEHIYQRATNGRPLHTIDLPELLELIDEVPTVDAVPVRHGRWIVYNYPASECTYCSVCKEQYDQVDLYIGGNEYPKYCPNCGALMDGEEI